ncbi:hypothetical protein J6590_099879 [Homalodisca vitripennis]|nr:hypothetical protein J6590_099879 [Homalodisca vitripennis]
MSTFNAADDEQLVELVAGHRILWDYSEKDFKNTLKKELIWTEIARLLNKTGEQCKKRWRNIRDHYKKMKSQDSNISTGSAAPKKELLIGIYYTSWIRCNMKRSSFSNATESDIETAHVEENTHVPESEQVDETLPPESNEGPTSGAVSGNSSTSKRKVKRAFSKVGESSFELEGVQPKTKKVSNKQEIVTLLKTSADDRQILNKYLEQSIETEKEDEIDAFVKGIGLTIK